MSQKVVLTVEIDGVKVGSIQKFGDPAKWACKVQVVDDEYVLNGYKSTIEEAIEHVTKQYHLVQTAISKYIAAKGLDKPQTIEYDGRGGVK